jgi:hypothetical protein
VYGGLTFWASRVSPLLLTSTLPLSVTSVLIKIAQRNFCFSTNSLMCTPGGSVHVDGLYLGIQMLPDIEIPLPFQPCTLAIIPGC